jgi:hypothetical protein
MSANPFAAVGGAAAAPPFAIAAPAPAAAPGVLFTTADEVARDEEKQKKWRLQVQALTIAPMELLDFQKSDAVTADLRRLQHPYLGCLLNDKPVFEENSDCDGAFNVLGLRDDERRLFRPFPKLTALERSILHAEAFGEKSKDSLDNPASIPFLWNIQQDVCKLRYMPPKKKTVTLDIPLPPPLIRDTKDEERAVFVQKITLVKDTVSFFEVETNAYKFETAVAGSEKIVCQNVSTRALLGQSACAPTTCAIPSAYFQSDSHDAGPGDFFSRTGSGSIRNRRCARIDAIILCGLGDLLLGSNVLPKPKP